MTSDSVEPWVAVDDEPTAPPAGFGWDFPLPPGQATASRRMELAEKAEERERQERLAEHMEASHNRAVMEAMTRAHAANEAWDPSDPWKHYPTHGQRVEEAFAYMDLQAASELRVAKREAAKVLREHGVEAVVVVDANAPESQSPSPGVAPPASRALASGVGRADALGTKVRAAFERWATRTSGHQSTGCGCVACTGEDVHRADADAGLPPREVNAPSTQELASDDRRSHRGRNGRSHPSQRRVGRPETRGRRRCPAPGIR
jgi:hypothetical protein